MNLTSTVRQLLEGKLKTAFVSDYQKHSAAINGYAKSKNEFTHPGGSTKVSRAYRHIRDHIKSNEPTTEDQVLYHGTPTHPSELARTHSFVSTSTEHEKGLDHAVQTPHRDRGKGKHTGHLLHISVPKGSRISDRLSARESANHEKEHLISDRARISTDPEPFKTTHEKYAFNGKWKHTTVHHWKARLDYDGVSPKT